MPKVQPKKPKADAKDEDHYLAPSTAVGIYARSVVQKLGLPEPRKLSDGEKVLQLPENLGDCGSDELASLMTGFSAMQNYADYQGKIIETDLIYLDETVNDMVEQQIPSIRAATMAEKKARAKQHPKVREMSADADKVRAVYVRVNTLRDIYGRCYQTVSREISRRHGMVESG